MGLAEQIGSVLRTFSYSAFHRTSAIILAGGSGQRMGSTATKQFMTLCDMPVIVHSLLAFEKSEYIDEIIIVAKQDEVDLYGPIIKKYGINKVTAVVAGGESRQASVACGIEAISPKSDFVAIHDGARPLITTEQIKAVVIAAFQNKAATAAAPSKDTPKMVSKSRFIEESVEREKLWLMQTPQIFNADVYRAALFNATTNGIEATDDSALVKEAGFPVKIVDCGYENIKITTPVDLKLANIILRERQLENAADGQSKEDTK